MVIYQSQVLDSLRTMVMNPKNHPDNPLKGSAPVCNGHPTLIAYHSSSTLAALTLIKLFVKNVQISKRKKKL
jgi:hypothetical protein